MTVSLPPGSLLRTVPTGTDRVKTALNPLVRPAAVDTAGAGRYARQALAPTLSCHSRYPCGTALSWLQLCTLAVIRHDKAAAAYCGEQAQTVADALYRGVPTPRLRRLRAATANNRGHAAFL